MGDTLAPSQGGVCLGRSAGTNSPDSAGDTADSAPTAAPEHQERRSLRGARRARPSSGHHSSDKTRAPCTRRRPADPSRTPCIETARSRRPAGVPATRTVRGGVGASRSGGSRETPARRTGAAPHAASSADSDQEPRRPGVNAPAVSGSGWPVIANRCEEDVSEVIGLARADAFDREQRIDRRRPNAGHLAKRGVVEDHVRGDAALPRRLQAHRAEAIEQRAVHVLPRLCLDARPGSGRVLSRRTLASQGQAREARFILQQLHALLRQREHRIRIVVSPRSSALRARQDGLPCNVIRYTVGT